MSSHAEKKTTGSSSQCYFWVHYSDIRVFTADFRRTKIRRWIWLPSPASDQLHRNLQVHGRYSDELTTSAVAVVSTSRWVRNRRVGVIFNFYARRFASAVYVCLSRASVRQSACLHFCLSVTSRCSTETAKQSEW